MVKPTNNCPEGFATKLSTIDMVISKTKLTCGGRIRETVLSDLGSKDYIYLRRVGQTNAHKSINNISNAPVLHYSQHHLLRILREYYKWPIYSSQWKRITTVKVSEGLVKEMG